MFFFVPLRAIWWNDVATFIRFCAWNDGHRRDRDRRLYFLGGSHEASCMIMYVLRMNFRSLTNWRPVALLRRCPWRCGGFNGGDSLCRVIGPFSVMFRWRGLETHLARRWTCHPTSRRNITRQLRFSGLGSLWLSVDIWPLVLVAVVLWWWLFNLAGIDLSARFILRKSGKENRNTGIPVYL